MSVSPAKSAAKASGGAGPAAPAAQFDDMRAGTALRFEAGDEVVAAYETAEVLPALARVDAASRAGRWAYGFVAYDAAPAFDGALVTYASTLPAPQVASSSTAAYDPGAAVYDPGPGTAAPRDQGPKGARPHP
ncbi:MAG TPA: hypothetical protein VFQ96_06955, partial [Microbacteriaceae bacterium]|nr:hypothetical protein [Microbacteriaceae bacterium]